MDRWHSRPRGNHHRWDRSLRKTGHFELSEFRITEHLASMSMQPRLWTTQPQIWLAKRWKASFWTYTKFQWICQWLFLWEQWKRQHSWRTSQTWSFCTRRGNQKTCSLSTEKARWEERQRYLISRTTREPAQTASTVSVSAAIFWCTRDTQDNYRGLQ